MADLLVALGASFVLAFVMAGPKARRAPEARSPAKSAKSAKSAKR